MRNRFRKNANVRTYVAPGPGLLPLPASMTKFVAAFTTVLPVTRKIAMEKSVEAEFREAVRRENEVTNESIQTGQ